jgi:serine/threonine protein kinase
MACLDENLVIAFFSPGVTPDVVAEVDAHTAACEACRRMLATYAQLDPAAAARAPTELLVAAEDPSRSVAPVAALDAELVRRLAQAQADKRIGTLVEGKWQIERLLGMGGMAYVFAARHRNGRHVAMKLLRPELVLEPVLVQRFLREGYVANRIDHPGAVAILDDGVTEDGTPFLVMELLEGRTLRERIEREPLPLERALRVVADVLSVLAVAHDKGVVHRDLKPDNLFETDDGVVKVLDFGIARLRDQARPELDTRSGITMGTIGFMPPEQARGHTAEVDAQSDVWAMGATLYTLLTGRSVHVAATTNEALLLAMTAPVKPMAELEPALPPLVRALLDDALAFDKSARFASAQAMKNALETALPRASAATTERPPTLASVDPPRRSWRAGVIAAASIAFLIALMGTGVVTWRARTAPTNGLIASSVESAAPAPTAVTSLAAAPSEAPNTTRAAVPSSAPDAATTARPRKGGAARPPAPRASTSASPPGPAPADSRDPLGPRQ